MSLKVNQISNINAKFEELQRYLDDLGAGTEAFTLIQALAGVYCQTVKASSKVRSTTDDTVYTDMLNTGLTLGDGSGASYIKRDTNKLKISSQYGVKLVTQYNTLECASTGIAITGSNTDFACGSITPTKIITPNGTRPTPTTVGELFFDFALGKPIWCKQVSPSVVWVDAAGTVV